MGTKDIIKQRRQALGLTMKELAQKVGVSEATISRWESGNIASMKQTKIALLAQVLDVSPAILVSGETTPSKTKKVPKELKKLLEDEEIALNGRMMSAEDKEKMMRIIEAAFYEAKEMNKRK